MSEPLQRGQPCPKNSQTHSRDAIGLAAFFRREWLNPTLVFQPSDGPVERSRAQAHTAKARNVFNHRVPMLRSVSQAGQNQQRRIRKLPQLSIFDGIYVSSSTHDVVIPAS